MLANKLKEENDDRKYQHSWRNAGHTLLVLFFFQASCQVISIGMPFAFVFVFDIFSTFQCFSYSFSPIFYCHCWYLICVYLSDNFVYINVATSAHTKNNHNNINSNWFIYVCCVYHRNVSVWGMVCDFIVARENIFSIYKRVLTSIGPEFKFIRSAVNYTELTKWIHIYMYVFVYTQLFSIFLFSYLNPCIIIYGWLQLGLITSLAARVLFPFWIFFFPQNVLALALVWVLKRKSLATNFSLIQFLLHSVSFICLFI